jgi:uncharacterized protein
VLWILAIVLVLVGLAGAVLPGLPGPVLVFAGILTAAWADDFARIGPWTLVLLGVMTAAAHLVDLVSAAVGVRRAGASGRAVLGAGAGALAGLFFGLPGLVIGPFVGAALAELTVRPDLRGAGRAGAAAWVGFIVGSIAKLAIIVAMLSIAALRFVFF